MRMPAAILGCALAISAFADDGEKAPLGEIADRAVQQSKLTLPGSRPFHLTAEVIETTNLDSDYKAKIEQHWCSPEKWRRTIESPEFSQTLVVNGDRVSEKDTGDYFPWWLNDLLTAMTDPLPMLDTLKQINMQITKPNGSERSITCADLRRTYDLGVFCFEGSHGLLTTANTRGYQAELKNFKDFGSKRIARTLAITPESGTTIQATITELTELSEPDDRMFAIERPTSLQERIGRITVDEDAIRKLSTTGTAVEWPTVGEGLTKGRCSVFVSVDRTGRMREVWPAGCDNPGLQDPIARERQEMAVDAIHRKWRSGAG